MTQPVVLITGCSSGIGRALADAFKGAGYQVFAAARKGADLEALNAASRQQTTLMVTHQLEGIADWDQIWVMENGRIVEQGDYASLVAAQGPFAALLANRQEDI